MAISNNVFAFVRERDDVVTATSQISYGERAGVRRIPARFFLVSGGIDGRHMHPVNQQEEGAPEGCSGKCERCDLAGPGVQSVDEGYAGWRMVLLSTVVFLLPLLTAVAGALVKRGSANAEVGGAAVGFLAGVLMAIVVVRCIKPRKSG